MTPPLRLGRRNERENSAGTAFVVSRTRNVAHNEARNLARGYPKERV